MESLKPNDDGEAHPHPDPPATSSDDKTDGPTDQPQHLPVTTTTTTTDNGVSTNRNTSPTSSERAKDQVMAVASANARATLRRTQLSKKRVAVAESMLTGDGAAPNKYRSKSLVIVYYDSYVQSFFEELVKFVSASRNLMRKAKMAAKVAQIKRMAELEMPDDESEEDEEMEFTAKFIPQQRSPPTLQPDGPVELNRENVNGGDENKSPQLAVDTTLENRSPNGILTTSFNANRLSSYTRSNGNNIATPPPRITSPIRPSMALSSSFGAPQQPDIYDELDKALESVQSMCEHAAHQFLRDGDCADDITKIQDKLTETKNNADKEMQKMLENDMDGILRKKLAEGPVRNRTYRPQSMRRDATFAKVKATINNSGPILPGGGFDGGSMPGVGLENSPVVSLGSPMALEVDDAIDNGRHGQNWTAKV